MSARLDALIRRKTEKTESRENAVLPGFFNFTTTLASMFW
jgi:hypothetical protein